MHDLVGRVQRLVAEGAAEYRLPLAADKEKLIVLEGGCGRKKRRGRVVEKVKWLGVSLDNRPDFKEHWQHRIGKACSILVALGDLVIQGGELIQ